MKRYWLRKIILSLASVSWLIACNKTKEVEYTYYPDGKIHQQIEVEYTNTQRTNYRAIRTTYRKDGSYTIAHYKGTASGAVQEGISKSFFPSGRLESVGSYVAGESDGKGIIYHKNGTTAQINFFKRGIRVGPQIQYFDNGQLWRVIDFVSLRGKEKEMGFVEYDRQGKLVQQTSRAVVQPASDTATVGDSILVRFWLIKPPFPTTRLLINGFDQQFRPSLTQQMDTVECGADHTAKFSFKANEVGWQYIRGVAENYEIVNKQIDTLTMRAKHVYFEQPIYVRPVN